MSHKLCHIYSAVDRNKKPNTLEKQGDAHRRYSKFWASKIRWLEEVTILTHWPAQLKAINLPAISKCDPYKIPSPSIPLQFLGA
jgi:hypothetical protein